MAALLPGAASAGPEPERGLLVVAGQGGTTTVVQVAREVDLGDPRPQLEGGRSHAGVLIESLEVAGGPPVRVGAVRVTAFRDGTQQAQALLGPDSRLRPGSYRVTLLGDGPVRAAYALSDPDGAGLRVLPRTPLRTQFFGRAEPLPAGSATAAVHLPRTLPRDRRAIQVLLLAAPHLDAVRMCATTGPDCDPRPVPPATADGGPQIVADLVQPAAQPRDLRWKVEGYRLADDRLRAAAIIF